MTSTFQQSLMDPNQIVHEHRTNKNRIDTRLGFRVDTWDVGFNPIEIAENYEVLQKYVSGLRSFPVSGEYGTIGLGGRGACAGVGLVTLNPMLAKTCRRI